MKCKSIMKQSSGDRMVLNHSAMKMCFKLDELLFRLFTIYFILINGILKFWKQKLLDERSKHEIWIANDKITVKHRLHKVQQFTDRNRWKSQNKNQRKNPILQSHYQSITFWRKERGKELTTKPQKPNPTLQE